jgi:hypothetical protein
MTKAEAIIDMIIGYASTPLFQVSVGWIFLGWLITLIFIGIYYFGMGMHTSAIEKSMATVEARLFMIEEKLNEIASILKANK